MDLRVVRPVFDDIFECMDVVKQRTDLTNRIHDIEMTSHAI